MKSAKFSSQLRPVPQGVMPPLQLARLPTAFGPPSIVAAGPVSTTGVVASIRRAKVPSPESTDQRPALLRLTRTTDMPTTACSLRICSGVFGPVPV